MNFLQFVSENKLIFLIIIALICALIFLTKKDKKPKVPPKKIPSSKQIQINSVYPDTMRLRDFKNKTKPSGCYLFQKIEVKDYEVPELPKSDKEDILTKYISDLQALKEKVSAEIKSISSIKEEGLSKKNKLVNHYKYLFQFDKDTKQKLDREMEKYKKYKDECKYYDLSASTLKHNDFRIESNTKTLNSFYNELHSLVIPVKSDIKSLDDKITLCTELIDRYNTINQLIDNRISTVKVRLGEEPTEPVAEVDDTPSTIEPIYLQTGLFKKCKEILDTPVNAPSYNFVIDESVVNVPEFSDNDDIFSYTNRLNELKENITNRLDKTLKDKEEFDKVRNVYFNHYKPILDAELQAEKQKKTETAKYAEYKKAHYADIRQNNKDIATIAINEKHLQENYRELHHYTIQVSTKLKDIYIMKKKFEKTIEMLEESLLAINSKLDEMEQMVNQAIEEEIVPIVEEPVEVIDTETVEDLQSAEKPVIEEIISNPVVEEESSPQVEKTELDIMNEIRASWRKERQEQEEIEEHRRKFREEQKAKQQEAEEKLKNIRNS